MYEAVRARPDGDATVARLALTASEYGFDGVVVRNHGDALPEYDPEVIRDRYDVDVVPGVEVRAEDPSRASGFVGNHRSKQVIVAVHGGDPAINRFAVHQPAVDVLAHPMRDGDAFDHVLAKAAAENGVRVEFALGALLRDSGGERVRRLERIEKLRDLVRHYDVPYVVSAEPDSHLRLRAPRELEAVGAAAGLTAEEVRTGLAEWERLATRNRDRRSDDFVEPGVWRVDGE